MIENAKSKNLIIPGKLSKTLTGKSLTEICHELHLNELKEILEKI